MTQRSTIEPQDPGAPDLVDAVRSMLSQRPGIADADISLRPSAHGSSRPLYEVDVRTGREHLALMLKDVSPGAELPGARDVRPGFLYHPLREISVYRHFLSPNNLGARFFGCRIARASDRYLLLIERVQAVALDYQEFGEPWEAALRWIAALHSRGIASLHRPLAGRLRRIDGAALALWSERAVEAAERTGSPRSGELARLRASAPRLAREFDQLERSFIHGEMYASNVLVDGAGRVVPVDWELAAIGPAGIDVAAITSGRWSDPERERMMDVYRASRAGRGGVVAAREVDLCRLLLALQWCGWSQSWQPPADESQDWVAEALAAAERLEV